MIIGIDMSKNSPGVCLRDGDNVSFISFIRGSETKRNKAHFDSLRDNKVKIVFNPRSTKLKDYTELEVWKISDASQLANTIVENLPDEIDMVGMEGFSYGSKGNAGLDIAGYAYCLRKTLFEKYGSEKMCIFSPANVKKTAGKGNAGKEEMLNFFLTKNSQDLVKNEFWKGLKNGTITYTTNPISDLIDAYYVQECALIYSQNKNIK